MRVLILGGDGYLGWPTAMYLSRQGYEVSVADNYIRRSICRDLNVLPLFGVPNLHQRVCLWKELSGCKISLFIGDLCKWDFVRTLFQSVKPDAVIHYAEQPSAPFSMLDRESAKFTLINNLQVTFNVIYAVKKFTENAHVVKLGTMGEYGTPNIDIEEGWIEVEHKGRKQKFIFPRQASSLYHTTKIMDTDLLWFYARTWGLRVTDLMQGPVYGLKTSETDLDNKLLPFFNYDEIFGTVINRFIVQAVSGYPLTVYGSGGQTRGYIDIRDTLQCVRLSMENPPLEGELRIFNQFVETFSVNELAEKIRQAGDRFKLNVKIKSVENPRCEAESHYYNPVHTGLLSLGLKPHHLTDEVIDDMIERILVHKEDIDPHVIFKGINWN